MYITNIASLTINNIWTKTSRAHFYVNLSFYDRPKSYDSIGDKIIIPSSFKIYAIKPTVRNTHLLCYI